jgi:hypothetical protein
MQPRERFSSLLKVVLFLALTAPLLSGNALAGSRYKVLHAFGAGGGLYSSLILDGEGSLYGELGRGRLRLRHSF